MAENAFVKIGTALLKHQVKKLVGDEALGAISEELADIGGDKLDAWLGDNSTIEELKKAALIAHNCFHDSVDDYELEQWMVSLPIGDLPKVLEAIEKLPISPDEKQLEIAIHEAVAGWRKLSPEQVDNAVNSFLSCLRSALLPIEKQTLMVIGRSVLRTEDKVERLLKLVENLQAIRQPAATIVKGQLNTGWFYGHRYGDLATFTGRADELKMLDAWLGNKTESLLIINAFGGFGKSALTWHWLNNNVDEAKWPTAIWWSFYEKESGFESFLAEALTHLGMETKERSARQQVNDLLDAMQKTNILIVLDGFERLLRQYARMDAVLQDDEEDKEIDQSQRDCTSQPAEVFLRGLSDKKMVSKVLMTSRLFPRVLEGKDGKLQRKCREANLQGLSPSDAVTYFRNEGITATRAEIVEVCSAYGFHPLSLSLLVGWINREDGNEHRGDIVEAKNLYIFDNIKANRHHVLERAYQSLNPERRDLLSKISCFRGSMEYAVLKKVFPSPDLDKALLDLRKRGLLQYAGETQRYDMHPIVRHYAYDHFTDEKRRKEAHIQLAEHFIDIMPVTNTNVKTLEDLAPVIELYHHMVSAGNLDEAEKLFRERLVPDPLYFQFGAYQLIIELLRALFLDGEDKPPRLKDESAQAWTLNTLATVYSMSGQPHRAVPLYLIDVDYDEKHGRKQHLAIGLGAVAKVALLPIGVLKEAERNLRRQIDLSREVASEAYEAAGHQELGRILSYRGAWQESERELDSAIAIQQKIKHIQIEGVSHAYRALRFLLMARANPQSSIVNLKSAIKYAQRALELANETAREQNPYPVDYIRAYWLLGAVYRENGELEKAEENLSKAISICRQINMVIFEADILLDLARLRYDQENYEEAKSLAEEAFLITERCGYVLQGADVNLFLAELASLAGNSEQGLGLGGWGGKELARQYAQTALKLATCDGPPYYYKVAYDEAVAMLERLKV